MPLDQPLTDTLDWPVTLFDETFAEEDFEGNNYIVGLPRAFKKFVLHAASLHLGTSGTTLNLGTGAKVLQTNTGKPWLPGTPLRIASQSQPSTAFMDTIVTSYDPATGALTVNAVGSVGEGAFNTWNLSAGGGGYAISGNISLAQGGTGANTAPGARANLGLGNAAVLNVYDGAISPAANAGRIVSLDNTGKLPPLDGSRLTGIAANSLTGFDAANINYRNVANSIAVAGPGVGMTGLGDLQLGISSGGNTPAGITFRRTTATPGALSANLGLDSDGWLSTQGPGVAFVNLKAGALRASAYLQLGDSQGSILGPPAGQFGSFDVTGAKAGFGGFRFTSLGVNHMVNVQSQGYYREGPAQWLVLWQGGVLTVGTVPLNRIPEIGGASVAFANSAGSAPANGGTATFATYPVGGNPGVTIIDYLNNLAGRIGALGG